MAMKRAVRRFKSVLCCIFNVMTLPHSGAVSQTVSIYHLFIDRRDSFHHSTAWYCIVRRSASSASVVFQKIYCNGTCAHKSLYYGFQRSTGALFESVSLRSCKCCCPNDLPLVNRRRHVDASISLWYTGADCWREFFKYGASSSAGTHRFNTTWYDAIAITFGVTVIIINSFCLPRQFITRSGAAFVRSRHTSNQALTPTQDKARQISFYVHQQVIRSHSALITKPEWLLLMQRSTGIVIKSHPCG